MGLSLALFDPSAPVGRQLLYRTDDPLTDVMAQGKPDPSWGLHLNDANLGMGDLVDIVDKQGKAWKKAHP